MWGYKWCLFEGVKFSVGSVIVLDGVRELSVVGSKIIVMVENDILLFVVRVCKHIRWYETYHTSYDKTIFLMKAYPIFCYVQRT